MSPETVERLSSFLVEAKQLSVRKLISCRSITHQSTLRTSRKGVEVLSSVDDLCAEDYKTVIKIDLIDKRCEKSGWLSAKW